MADAKSPITVFQETIAAKRDEYAQMLPEGVSVDRFMRTTTTAVVKNPDLLSADRKSLFLAIRQACAAGLEISDINGEAYLVIRRTKGGGREVQFQAGYRGLLKLVRNTGEISTIDAGVLYENDEIDYQRGTDPRFSVVPNWTDPGKPIGAFAVAVFKDGGFQAKVMSTAEVEKIRARSPAKDNGPWKTDWEAMATKTAIRQLAKLLPTSTVDRRVEQLLLEDDDAEAQINALPTSSAPSAKAPAPRIARQKKERKTDPDELAERLASEEQNDGDEGGYDQASNGDDDVIEDASYEEID